MNEFMCECLSIYEGMHEWLYGGMDEWMYVWMNGWMKVWLCTNL